MAPNPAKIRARQRVREAKDRNKAKKFDFISVRRGIGVDEVHCILCGTLIRKLIPVSDMGEERVRNGVTIIRERLAVTETNQYAEVIITFNDGSKHHSPTCKQCAGSLDIDDLEVIYSADMNQWDREEDSGFGNAKWNLLADRIPVSYERVR